MGRLFARPHPRMAGLVSWHADGSYVADIMEVFTDSQSYAKSPDQVLKKAGELKAKDWGLRPASEIKRDTDYVESGPGILDEIPAILEDHRRRELTMEPSVLYKAISSGAFRFAGALEEVIKNPDEVWINNQEMDGFNSFVYIRYYRNQTIRVIARLDQSGNLKIISWGSIAANPEESRRGLAVKSALNWCSSEPNSTPLFFGMARSIEAIEPGWASDSERMPRISRTCTAP